MRAFSMGLLKGSPSTPFSGESDVFHGGTGAFVLCQVGEDVFERKAVVRWNAERFRAGDGL